MLHPATLIVRNKKYSNQYASVRTGSTSCDTKYALKAHMVSHLTGTIKYPNWVTIDFMILDIHVDSAFHTTLFCLARLPGLYAAAQTAAVRGVHHVSKCRQTIHCTTNTNTTKQPRETANDADPLRQLLRVAARLLTTCCPGIIACAQESHALSRHIKLLARKH